MSRSPPTAAAATTDAVADVVALVAPMLTMLLLCLWVVKLGMEASHRRQLEADGEAASLGLPMRRIEGGRSVIRVRDLLPARYKLPFTLGPVRAVARP